MITMTPMRSARLAIELDLSAIFSHAAKRYLSQPVKL